MAGRGFAPKNPDQVRYRNKPFMLEVLPPSGGLHGPELPDSHEWPDATLAWWDVWRASPQAVKFTDTDWSFLLDTAVLHAEYWLGDKGVAAELRLRVAKFGATPEDRARLRIAVGDPNEPPASRQRPPRKTQNRRKRLLQAVDDGGDV